MASRKKETKKEDKNAEHDHSDFLQGMHGLFSRLEKAKQEMKDDTLTKIFEAIDENFIDIAHSFDKQKLHNTFLYVIAGTALALAIFF